MAQMAGLRWHDWLLSVGQNGCFYSSANNRVVQSFPSRESMLRLTCASLMETEGQWSQQRVFSEASAAEGFAEPAGRPAPTEGRRRALGRRAREIVDEIVERRGLKKE